MASHCGFLGPVVSQVVKKEQSFGVTFPEYLEEVTNCFDYLKMEAMFKLAVVKDGWK